MPGASGIRLSAWRWRRCPALCSAKRSRGSCALKCGGNYAAGLRAQAEAIEDGCDQVVFLDAVERRYIEELGGMNVFFVFDDNSLLTPPLGTILPGITRDSIIALAKDSGT